MLPTREEFKEGFIKQCCAEGLNEAQTLDRIKAAVEMNLTPHLETTNKWYHSFKPSDMTRGQVLTGAGALAITVPFGVGALAGHGASSLKGNYTDEADVKKQEIIDELKRQTILAKQHQRLSGLKAI